MHDKYVYVGLRYEAQATWEENLLEDMGLHGKNNKKLNPWASLYISKEPQYSLCEV